MINSNLTSFSTAVEWFYKGDSIKISSQSDFNKLLSVVCNEIYHLTPVVQSELFNKQKVNSAISQARVTLLNMLLDDNCVIKEDLGFEKEVLLDFL